MNNFASQERADDSAVSDISEKSFKAPNRLLEKVHEKKVLKIDNKSEPSLVPGQLVT